MPRRATLLLAATALAVAALFLYRASLLPGQDLGDTASFQGAAGDFSLKPRDAYPLYFAIVGTFARALPAEPAHAANLASAACAAVAVGITALVGAELGGTLAAGLAAGALLAVSYTFWSQAVIAEVYTLHLLLSGLGILAALGWARRPSMPRLALFFAVYALAFGNHLSTILLLPAFAVFVLVSAPGGPRRMLRPRVVALALVIAAAGALQYAWNFSALLHEPGERDVASMLATFWFDVTKADWRAAMVDGIRLDQIPGRLAMYAFDLRQQVGLPGMALALMGAVFVARTRWRAGLLLGLIWGANWLFAFTYAVGDTHVFYLPAHLCVCLAAGCGTAWLALALRAHLSKSPRPGLAAPSALALTLGLLAYPAWRAWDDWPMLDRSGDRAATIYFDRLTAGLTDRDVFVRDLNWEAHNGLDYYARHTRPDLPMFDGPSNLQALPFLVWSNASRGRDIVLTAGMADMVGRAFGTLFPIDRDPRVDAPTLSEAIAALPRGTPYVLVALWPYREWRVPDADVALVGRAFHTSNGEWPTVRYAVAAGLVGSEPTLRLESRRPFRAHGDVAGIGFEVRIEAWLPDDTIRRAGFGRILCGRNPVLTLDRGASFVAFNGDGTVRLARSSGGVLSLLPRYLIRHTSVAP